MNSEVQAAAEGFSNGSNETNQPSERKKRLISILKRIKDLEMENGNETTVAKKDLRRRLEIHAEMTGNRKQIKSRSHSSSMNDKPEIRSFAIQRFMEDENEVSRGNESEEIVALDVLPDPKPVKPLKPKVAVARSAEEVRKVGEAQGSGAGKDETEDIQAVALHPSASMENRLSLILPDVDELDFKSIQNAGGACHQNSRGDMKLNLNNQYENIADLAEEVEREQVSDGDQEKKNQHVIQTQIGNDSSDETKVSKIKNKKTRSMKVCMDENSYPYFVLPAVASSPIFTRSENGAGAELVRGVKKLLWAREDVPPALSIPDRLYYVTGPGDLFEEAIIRLQQVDKLGVSLEGEVVGRHGTPSLLLLSTDIETFAFDLYNMGENAFRWGLNSVLTEPRVIKVVHDSRQLSDLLYHQFGGLLLENVFDTLAAHLVFSNWLLVDGAGRARPQQHNAVRDYLGISCEHIYVPRLGAAADLRLDTAHWLTRPLSQAQLLDAARNCIYLLPLSEILLKAVELPLIRATDALLASYHKGSEEERRNIVRKPHLLPVSIGKCLPIWLQSE